MIDERGLQAVRHRLRERRPVERQGVGQAVAVLGQEGRAFGGMDDAFAGTESAKASKPPASSEDRIMGKVTNRKVVQR